MALKTLYYIGTIIASPVFQNTRQAFPAWSKSFYLYISDVKYLIDFLHFLRQKLTSNCEFIFFLIQWGEKMKIWKLLIAACMTAFLFSCGGGGSGGAGDTPKISKAMISPSTATQNQGGGTINVNLSMNFKDSGGDVTSFTLNTYDANKNQLTTDTVPISGTSGVISGTITATLPIPTTTIGNYTWKIFVTDAGSRTSNTLSGSFSITAQLSTQSSGTITLNGGNTYESMTTINNGTLGSGGSTFSSEETIEAGGEVVSGTHVSILDGNIYYTIYPSETANLSSDIASIEAQATAAGNYGSQDMAYDILTAKLSHVQSFLNDVVADIQTSKNTYGTIDMSDITNILASYQAQDLAWPSSLAVTGVNSDWLQNFANTTSPTYATSINNLYNAAIAQINAM